MATDNVIKFSRRGALKVIAGGVAGMAAWHAVRDAAAGDAGPDAAIAALFRQWIEAQRSADRWNKAHPDDEDGFDALIEGLADFEHQMARLPAAGIAGLAIKAYMVLYHDNGGSNVDAPALSSIMMNDRDDPERYTDTHLMLSLIRDLPLFVPEMAPLVAPVLAYRPEGAA